MKQEVKFDTLATNILQQMEETDDHIFLTGKAGTGKSTLLKQFLSTTSKNIAVLAPTGIAALNIGGVTIHSFFHFGAGITIKKAKNLGKFNLYDEIYTELQTIVIDEISMVRADLLDCIDAFLKAARESRKAFGGVQIIMIGDLYQLPPVVSSFEKEFFEKEYESPYFFDAKIIKKIGSHMKHVELEKIHRQSDQNFVDILNAIRLKTVNDQHLHKLNTRVTKTPGKIEEGMVYLAGTNAKVEEINQRYLQTLESEEFYFTANINGKINEKAYPTDPELCLKKGSQVMFIANDPEGRRVNGTIGKITQITKEEVSVQIYGGEEVEVEPHMRKVIQYEYNQSKKRLDANTIGSMTQLPITLARAVTIHKSQGKTFDKVIIDVSAGIFSHGQTYVALSRCRTLEGIQLTVPVNHNHVKLDYRVVNFLFQNQNKEGDRKSSIEFKIQLLKEVINKKGRVRMTYIKGGEQKSYQELEPYEVGEMKYKDIPFIGLKGYCHTSKHEKLFSVQRILDVEEIV